VDQGKYGNPAQGERAGASFLMEKGSEKRGGSPGARGGKKSTAKLGNQENRGLRLHRLGKVAGGHCERPISVRLSSEPRRKRGFVVGLRRKGERLSVWSETSAGSNASEDSEKVDRDQFKLSREINTEKSAWGKKYGEKIRRKEAHSLATSRVRQRTKNHK